MTRICDVLLASSAMLLLLPFLAPLCIILRLTGEGEVLFRQSRVGKGRVNFDIYKFATMLKDSPNIGTGTVTVKDDPRVLPLGRFLRKTKVNELPQLLNVLKGDMSIVGPRPQTQRCFDDFPPELQDQIISVSPGLTGLGSIFFRDEENMLLTQVAEAVYAQDIMPYKAKLEAWYVTNKTLWLYWKIILVTAYVLVAPKTSSLAALFPDAPKFSNQ